MANYCTECGSMIPQDSKFCPGCGKQQSASDARQAAQPQPRPPKYAPQKLDP